MYEVKESEKCRLLSFIDGEWFIVGEFETGKEFVGYLAKTCRRDLFSDDGNEISSPIVDSRNMNGNDVQTYAPLFSFLRSDYEPRITEVRPYMLVSEDGRILDPRDFLIEAVKEFEENENKPKRFVYRRKEGRFEFRKDPVPGTGAVKRKFCRKTRNWFHNRRLDFIPEHSEFVRKKAVVNDVWDSEPFEDGSRSWKDSGKFRKQWQRKQKKKKF